MNEKRKKELQAKINNPAWMDEAIDRLGSQFADAVDANGGTVFENRTPPPEEYVSKDAKYRKRLKAKNI